MRNYIQAYRNYHRLTGKILFMKEVLDQKDVFHRSPSEFVDQMNQISLDFRSIPLDFISDLFKANENELSATKFDSNLLHVTEWLVLSSISIGMQKFVLARELREKATQRISEYIESYNPLKWLRIDSIIGGLIDTENFHYLKKYIRVAQILRTACGRNRFSDKILSLIKGELPSVSNHIEANFRAFLSGKSIAIVGPLKLTAQNEEEIRGREVVITMNDLSFLKGREFPSIKPDIIYLYRDLQETLVNKSKESDFQYIPEFLVYNLDENYSPFLKKRTRVRDDINPFTFSGSFNFVPRIILDVLLHGGNNIKVYGTDLYTSIDIRSSYEGDTVEDWDGVLKQFVVHDLITNYKFMHSFWSKGLYQAEERLEQVMEMDLDGYLDYFEKKSFAMSE